MARYIDVEGYRKLFDEEYKKTRKLIAEGETHLDNLAEGFSEASRVIDSIPTADVVPKSEADFLRKTIAENAQRALEITLEEIEKAKVETDLYKRQVDELEDELATAYDRLENARQEVAREIFEEIEKLSHRFMNDEHYIFGDMVWDIAELKEKYTKKDEGGAK